MLGSGVISSGVQCIRAGGVGQGLLRCHRNEGTEAGVLCVDPGQEVLRSLPGGEFSGAQGVSEPHGGKFVDISQGSVAPAALPLPRQRPLLSVG